MYNGYNGNWSRYQPWYGGQRRRTRRNTTTRVFDEWRGVSGQVISPMNRNVRFRGNETLEVSVVDASLMDAPSVVLGRDIMRLQPGQRFPIPFQIDYNQARSAAANGDLTMQARITDANEQLLFVNDTRTPLRKNVLINVVRT